MSRKLKFRVGSRLGYGGQCKPRSLETLFKQYEQLMIVNQTVM